MTIVAVTREMGTLGKDVATGLGEALGLPVIYHEIIDNLADRMRVRRSHVVRLLDGKAGLFERLSADRTSLFLHSAEEVIDFARQGKGAVIRGWGATHLLRDVPHVICVRVCAPLELRRQRMMERLNTEDAATVEAEIHSNDEAHTAIMRRHFGIRWTEPEHYDLVLNTKRVSVGECVDGVLNLARLPKFAQTVASRQRLEDLALSARVRAALRRSPEARDTKVDVSSESGVVTLSSPHLNTDERLALVEVVVGVPGVRDVAWRSRERGESGSPPH
ncbi:MAG: cytidylate kinase family protein [Betaproteobacteria bacterium]|nr:cytidylate kinase family protein [Betaproteobacteria bacterium]